MKGVDLRTVALVSRGIPRGVDEEKKKRRIEGTHVYAAVGVVL